MKKSVCVSSRRFYLIRSLYHMHMHIHIHMHMRRLTHAPLTGITSYCIESTGYTLAFCIKQQYHAMHATCVCIGIPSRVFHSFFWWWTQFSYFALDAIGCVTRSFHHMLQCSLVQNFIYIISIILISQCISNATLTPSLFSFTATEILEAIIRWHRKCQR